MPVHFKQKSDKNRYWFVNDQCLGCECFQPGLYQHRGATMSGSRNTGSDSATCMRNAYHGCPNDADRGYSEAMVAHRKKEGWKRV